MEMNLQKLCEKVTEISPTARATIYPLENQIIVSFTNRPDVEIALLTPYLQQQIKKGSIEDSDLIDLMLSVKRIGNCT